MIAVAPQNRHGLGVDVECPLAVGPGRFDLARLGDGGVDSDPVPGPRQSGAAYTDELTPAPAVLGAGDDPRLGGQLTTGELPGDPVRSRVEAVDLDPSGDACGVDASLS